MSKVLCQCGCKKPAPLIAKTDKRRGWVKGEHASYIAGHYQRMKLKASDVPARDVSDPITEKMIAEIRKKWSRQKAAEFYDKRTRNIESMHRTSFIEQGMILNEMSESELYREVIDPNTDLAFTSFDRWLIDAAPVSRTTGYAAMKALNDLHDVPIEQLRHMPRCNVEVMRGLSSKVRRDPDVLEAAQNESERGFIEMLQEKHPSQHVESRPRMTLKPTTSARQLIELGIDAVCWCYDLTSREEAMENLVAYFMDGKCEREGFSDFTNREAYAKTQKKGAA